MAAQYKWISSLRSKAVLEKAAELAILQKKIFFPMTFVYENISDKESKFRLVYDPIGTTRLRFTYTPPGLSGIVTNTPKGCEITAAPWAFKAIMCNIAHIFLVIFLYLAGFIPIFLEPDIPVTTVAICLGLAVWLTWSLFYTYKKYRNLQRHLEIMNIAAGVNYVGFSLEEAEIAGRNP